MFKVVLDLNDVNKISIHCLSIMSNKMWALWKLEVRGVLIIFLKYIKENKENSRDTIS